MDPQTEQETWDESAVEPFRFHLTAEVIQCVAEVEEKNPGLIDRRIKAIHDKTKTKFEASDHTLPHTVLCVYVSTEIRTSFSPRDPYFDLACTTTTTTITAGDISQPQTPVL
ncbi:hypothetical protein PISL3812_09909 [Talaromyces islandicus]|uniref:Uncharacterized protein n=1 Tax=Talaromyces islandicus TaxID=28573 RepID=A0A0U1MB76_TALIS|nr:hypothetical protein PISL3812_09909 [Talaromyces islandicus]